MIVVELTEERLGLLKIGKEYGVVGEVKLQTLIGDPWVENCREMTSNKLRCD